MLHDHPADDAVELSVVVPAFNESARLGRTLAAIRDYLGRSGRTWEVIVVDDGSTDDTSVVVEQAIAGWDGPQWTSEATRSGVRLIRLPQNRGKGHAVRVGVLSSRGRMVLMCDADLSTPITEVEALLAALESGVAAAIGSRALTGSTIAVHQHRAREALGRLGNRFIRLAAVPGIADTQCGFKLFDGVKGRTVFARTRLDGWGFDVEALHLFRRLGWPVAEVPVRWAHADGSRLRARAYGQVLVDVLRMRWWHRGSRVRPVGPIRTAPALDDLSHRAMLPVAAGDPDDTQAGGAACSTAGRH